MHPWKLTIVATAADHAQLLAVARNTRAELPWPMTVTSPVGSHAVLLTAERKEHLTGLMAAAAQALSGIQSVILEGPYEPHTQTDMGATPEPPTTPPASFWHLTLHGVESADAPTIVNRARATVDEWGFNDPEYEERGYRPVEFAIKGDQVIITCDTPGPLATVLEDLTDRVPFARATLAPDTDDDRSAQIDRRPVVHDLSALVATGTMEIGPDEARALLARATVRYVNARLDSRRVARYAMEMAEGRWKFTDDTIPVDQHGRLIDGLNRLVAVILSGTTQTMIIEQVTRQDLPDWHTGRQLGELRPPAAGGSAQNDR